MTANVAGYLLQLLAGRWLGVAGYSPFASLLAVQLLCAVPALALQNVVAREVVRGASVESARALALRCAGIVAVVAVPLAPIVSAVLKVSITASIAALVAAPILVLLSGEQGILQGRIHFRELALVLGGAGIARVTPALIVLGLGGGTTAALGAAAAGIAIAALAARRAVDLQESSRTGSDHEASAPAELSSGSGWERVRSRIDGAGVLPVFRAAQVQAALMALSSADLIVARIVLDENDAGRYSLGAIAAKIAFWLPQAVGVVLYPRMAQPQHSARAVRSALAVLMAVGAVAVAGAAVAAPLAPLFAGQDYAPVQGVLWVFALDGALLAILQAALLSAIAADRTAPAAITWIGLAVGVGIMLTCAHSVTSLITIATVTVAVTTVVITALALRTAHVETGSASRVPGFGASGT
ncbi:polysaccharide biosynthesis protein [Nocardia jejuensis]|uniref:polysaccharide biosynthesis protein n=1 Tax=Nocardia jejuensis TaxID=328049 RepID=UPI001FE081C5|nr:polysaccharide biosynthesis protein [Nocardia jejuensis]